MLQRGGVSEEGRKLGEQKKKKKRKKRVDNHEPHKSGSHSREAAWHGQAYARAPIDTRPKRRPPIRLPHAQQSVSDPPYPHTRTHTYTHTQCRVKFRTCTQKKVGCKQPYEPPIHLPGTVWQEHTCFTRGVAATSHQRGTHLRVADPIASAPHVSITALSLRMWATHTLERSATSKKTKQNMRIFLHASACDFKPT
jgi:hypothetical protein